MRASARAARKVVDAARRVASLKTGVSVAAAAAAAAALGGAVFADTPKGFVDGPRIYPRTLVKGAFPVIPLSEVKKHTSREAGCWVTFRGAVYDMTPFIDAHPGCSTRLLMSGGNDMDIYWKVYGQHHRGHIYDFMDKYYKIGVLTPEETKKAQNEFEFEDTYANDPLRDPRNLGCTLKPWCGEPRTDLLVENYYTPNALFYTRNHLPVPDLKAEDWRLEVLGTGVKPTTFTLDEIKNKFKKYDVVSTLQCAGNRREDMHNEKRAIFISPHWVIGAISNAKWSGARLRDVLAYCGMPVDDMALGKVPFTAEQAHVQFEAYDEDETGLTYGGSIPIDKAVDALGDCLVAYEMNGEPLPRDHGYPVRALAPGHAGTRQAKWLHKIIISDKESDKPWHQKSYRGFAPDISFEKDLCFWPVGLRLDQAPIVQEMPVQSLVCTPRPNTVLKGKEKDEIVLRGIAWCGGGRGIWRVDVSIDGGANFTAADLHEKPCKQIRNRQWGWYHWSKTIKLTEEMKAQLARNLPVKLECISKALSGDFNVQPENAEPYWNARGVCINHWYRVPVVLDPRVDHDYAPDLPEFGNTPSGGKFVRPWQHSGWDNSDPASVAAAEKGEHWPSYQKWTASGNVTHRER